MKVQYRQQPFVAILQYWRDGHKASSCCPS